MIETIYAGYYSEHPSTFSYHIDKDHTDWILLFVLTEFEIMVEQEWVRTPANCLVFFPPKAGGDYRACEGITFINTGVSQFPICFTCCFIKWGNLMKRKEVLLY